MNQCMNKLPYDLTEKPVTRVRRDNRIGRHNLVAFLDLYVYTIASGLVDNSVDDIYLGRDSYL